MQTICAADPLRPRARTDTAIDAVREGLFGAFGLDAEKEKVREEAAREEKLYRIKVFEPDLKLLSAATYRRMRRAWTNDLFCSLRMPSTGALLAARALRRSRYGADELGLLCRARRCTQSCPRTGAARARSTDRWRACARAVQVRRRWAPTQRAARRHKAPTRSLLSACAT